MGRHNVTEPTLPARSSVQDVYGSGVQLILSDNGYGAEPDTPRLKRQASNSSLNNVVALKNILHSNDGDADASASAKLASFAQLGRQSSEKVINFTYSNQDKDEAALKKATNIVAKKQQNQNNGNSNEKKTTFAALPNTTTWQQQSNQQNTQAESNAGGNSQFFSISYYF